MAGPWDQYPVVEDEKKVPAWEKYPAVGPAPPRAPEVPLSGGPPPPPKAEKPPEGPPRAYGIDPETGALEVDIGRRQPMLGRDISDENQRLLRQRVNPNALSPYFASSPEMKPKYLGDLIEDDEGAMLYTMPDAKGRPTTYGVNPQTDFVGRNPDTGKLAVYSRTRQTDESPLTSIARLVAQGMAVGPVTTSTPGSTAALLAAREAERQRLLLQQATGGGPLSSAAQPAGVTGPMGQIPGAVPLASRMADQNAEAIARDIAAHDELNIRKAPVAFQSRPGAEVSKMLERIPGVGYLIGRSVDQAVTGAAEAANDISSRLAPRQSVEHAGQTLKQGLDRYRGAGVEDIEPGQLTNIGIQPRAPGAYVGEVIPVTPGTRPPGLTGNPNRDRNDQLVYQAIRTPDGQLQWVDPAEHVVINDAGRAAAYQNSGRYQPLRSGEAITRAPEAQRIRTEITGRPEGTAQTHRGVTVDAARPIDQVYMGRRGAADLSDDELMRLINTPAPQTSYMARAEALYERALRFLPNMFRADASRNPIMLPTPNTSAALGTIDRQIANQIAGQSTINRDLAARLQNVYSNFSLDDLRAIRTEIGRALANHNPLVPSLDQAQLKSLYAAVTRDMETGLEDIANRAYLRTRLSPNAPDYLPPDVARRADQALYAFRSADRFYREGQHNMEKFLRVLGMDNPQAAMQTLINAATDGTGGNIGLLRNALAVLRPEERAEIAGMVLRQMGRPNPGAAGIVKEAGFSPTTFMKNWDKMDAEARSLLFGDGYANEVNGLSRSIHNLARVSGRLRAQEAMSNTSRSGSHLIQFAMMLMGIGSAMSGKAMWMAGGMGLASVPSVLLSRPSYVNWLARYARLRAVMERGNPNQFAPRVAVLYSQLHRMALKDPSLTPVLGAIAQEHGIGQGNKDDQGKEKQGGKH